MIHGVSSSTWFMACAVTTGISLDLLWLAMRPLPLPYVVKWLVIFWVGHQLLHWTVVWHDTWFEKKLPPPHFTWLMTLFHPVLVNEFMTVVWPWWVSLTASTS
jgi:hypothetical protein